MSCQLYPHYVESCNTRPVRIYNLIDFNTDNYLIPHTETRTRGSHPLKFQIPRANKDSFKFSYFPRTIKEWNQLPEHIVLSNSLEVFKSKLAEHF